MANSVDPDQTAAIGAVCSGSTLFVSLLILSVMLGNYLQATSADDIFRCIFFLGALRVNSHGLSRLDLTFVLLNSDISCVENTIYPNQLASSDQDPHWLKIHAYSCNAAG